MRGSNPFRPINFFGEITMWILKTDDPDVKDMVACSGSGDKRHLLREYARQHIEGVEFVLPYDYDKENFVNDPDMIFYVCVDDKKIGTIEWIEEI